VGEATTAAVVQAIVWMVVAASGLTVIFQRLGV
jgi:phospholipid/cholesterol/gamma-HCH transport system permease protein